MSKLKILSPTGEVFPYAENAKGYLQAGEKGCIADYYIKGQENPYIPVQIQWQFHGPNVVKFLVWRAIKPDFSDAIAVETDGDARVVDLYNLYKATKYYVCVRAYDKDGKVLGSAESAFQTTSLGPRVIRAEGIYNVRDIGGYQTMFGKPILQGVAYRGGALTVSPTAPEFRSILTEEGKRCLSAQLGIKAELDLRTEKESDVPLGQGSVIPNATLTYITSDGYEKIFDRQYAEAYRKVFSYMSRKENYPLYYHCTAGSDRTGSVSYILLAFLGVSALECRQDYEFSSFCIYGLRGTEDANCGLRYYDMCRLLNEYEGATLQEKAENYMRWLGVTQEEMDSIKHIFLGE